MAKIDGKNLNITYDNIKSQQRIKPSFLSRKHNFIKTTAGSN